MTDQAGRCVHFRASRGPKGAPGVFIDSACRSGTCGTCMVKVASGRVRMGTDEALTAEERQAGYVLACQATPGGHVEVVA